LRWGLIGVVILLLAGFYLFDLDAYFQLDYVKARYDELRVVRHAEPVLSGLAYFLIYVAVTTFSLPGAAVMTIAGGALFGLWWGSVLVSLASTAGATGAFLVARFILREEVQTRYAAPLAAVNRGIERDGPFYLFALRLVPLFPFFLVNLVMGLTPIRPRTFAWVSQLGMLPGTVVYVNAGTQLGQLSDPNGIVSPGLFLSLCLLGVFPMMSRRLTEMLRNRRALSGFSRPRSFDADVVVIGGGAAGLVSALVANALRAKVVLVERDRMGGDCLNTGCVPSKALIGSTRFLAAMGRGGSLGATEVSARMALTDVFTRVRSVVETISEHDCAERFESLGVECVAGSAHVVSPWEVTIGERSIRTRRIVVATGATPLVPPIPGLESVDYRSSETIWDLETLPRSMVVLGGGAIGCELGQCFARLGAAVTIVELAARLLPNEDPEVGERLEAAFRREGVDVLTGHKAVEFVSSGVVRCEAVDPEGLPVGAGVDVGFDLALVALGRRPSGSGFGLEAVGVEIAPKGAVVVDRYLRTAVPTIYACGDVIGGLQFTHVASHEAWHAVVNALLGGLRRFAVDYDAVPKAAFTEPEVASAGLTETAARASGIAYEATVVAFDELDRAVAEGQTEGRVKILTAPGRDRILGVSILGKHAADLIVPYVLAMRHRLGLKKILATVHPYPGWMEVNRLAAGRWRSEHAPGWLLALLERFHRWRRGGR